MPCHSHPLCFVCISSLFLSTPTSMCVDKSVSLECAWRTGIMSQATHISCMGNRYCWELWPRLAGPPKSLVPWAVSVFQVCSQPFFFQPVGTGQFCIFYSKSILDMPSDCHLPMPKLRQLSPRTLSYLVFTSCISSFVCRVQPVRSS